MNQNKTKLSKQFIYCFYCNKRVSTALMPGGVFRAIAVCPECVACGNECREEIQSHDKELMEKIKGLSGKLWQPVGGLSNIEWITKDQVLNLLQSKNKGGQESLEALKKTVDQGVWKNESKAERIANSMSDHMVSNYGTSYEENN